MNSSPSSVFPLFDVLVVGAGHAGIEAALAASRLGCSVAVLTHNLDTIGQMSCNPAIGGLAKGHIVREIDAMGGAMGLNTDATAIQFRMLNASKGPSVRAPRAQCDKTAYRTRMKMVLETAPGIRLFQGDVVKLLVNGEQQATGAVTSLGCAIHARSVIICSGTFMKGLLHVGLQHITGGRMGCASSSLSADLAMLGFQVERLKTGTSPRVNGRSIDFSVCEIQPGDSPEALFSYRSRDILKRDSEPFCTLNTWGDENFRMKQMPCWITYTNQTTHDIIRKNLKFSPLYSGIIEGVGPRYCPSIEDKIVRFAEKNSHQVFLEPEGLETDEMYIGGMSSSLPEDVQYAMYRSVPGLEHVKIVRNAYAIEYDCIDARQLKPSLEFRNISGLFSAGQFNGSSGYEEAAAQGLIAGINAARKLQGKESLVLDRSEAYIGVLIDDLVTKESHEPYRMMTSRAEYRLLLRQDNADQRLTEKGYEVGLISQERYDRLKEKERLIESEIERLKNAYVGTSEKVQELLESYESTPLNSGSSLAELIRRPELSYEAVTDIDVTRPELPKDLAAEVIEQVDISLKYDGYIQRQKRQVEQFKKMENKKIPEDMDYDAVNSLRIEAVQKLKEYRPVSIGQASRISGVSPADISVLLVYLSGNHR